MGEPSQVPLENIGIVLSRENPPGAVTSLLVRIDPEKKEAEIVARVRVKSHGDVYVTYYVTIPKAVVKQLQLDKNPIVRVLIKRED